MPAVSVIMPAYNAAGTIAAAIRSVRDQTLQDWELLVIDDGSTDNTLAIAQQLGASESRLRVFDQANRGVSATRNRGIELASGQWLAFLDADDRWFPGKLDAHLQHFRAVPDLAVSFTRVEFMAPDGRPTGNLSRSPLHGLTLASFLYENPTVTASNLCAHRDVCEAVGGFAVDMQYAEDLEWLCRIAHVTGQPIDGIDRVLMYYRTSQGGLSADLHRMEAGWDALIARVRTYAPDVVAQHYSLARAVHLRYLARRALRLGLPAGVGIDFLHRAIGSDGRIWFVQPHRTLLTAIALYGKLLITGGKA